MVDPPRSPPADRAVALVLLVIVGVVVVALSVVGILGGERCTTVFARPGSTSTTTPSTGTPAPVVDAGGPLQESTRTCVPGALIDPPLVVVLLGLLLLAVPALRLTEVGFAGLTLKTAVKDAAGAARTAAQSADRASAAVTAMLTSASARSTASGNIVNLTPYAGDRAARTGTAAAEAAVAFTMAASGVTSTLLSQVPGISAVVVFWVDRSTESFRPNTAPAARPLDLGSHPLSPVIRNAVRLPLQITTEAERTELGIPATVAVPARALALPLRRPEHRAVGMLLAVLDAGTEEELHAAGTRVVAEIEPFLPCVTILVETLTIAGSGAILQA